MCTHMYVYISTHVHRRVSRRVCAHHASCTMQYSTSCHPSTYGHAYMAMPVHVCMIVSAHVSSYACALVHTCHGLTRVYTVRTRLDTSMHMSVHISICAPTWISLLEKLVISSSIFASTAVGSTRLAPSRMAFRLKVGEGGMHLSGHQNKSLDKI